MGDIQLIEQRIEAIEKFIDKQEANNKRVWERIDKQSQDMVRLQVLMENIGKTLDELKISLNTLGKDQKSQSSKWEAFYQKAFWVIIGAAFSYFTYKSSIGH
jgi:Mg2+ and Co2+ transporter CorA